MIYRPVGIAVGRFVLGFLLLAPLACGGSDLVLPGPGSTGETAADIEAIEGNGQSGVAGTMLPDSIVVQVTDGTGAPVAGQQVEFAPSAPGAEVTPATATTDAGGIAWARWMLGVTSGTQTVIARVAGDTGLQIAFEASVRSASPQSIQAVNGDNQTGAAGTGLRDPLVVLVSDAFGNPVEDLAVTWIVGVGGGSVSSTTSLTDQDGQAQTRWTLGPNPGANTLNAVVSGVGVVAFSATAEGGGGGPTPARMRFVVQPTDVPQKHGIISPPVVVEVLDEAGNRVTDPEITIRLDLIEIRTGRSKGHETARTRSGLATYPDLRINVVGEFLLRATAPDLPPVDSEPFVTDE